MSIDWTKPELYCHAKTGADIARVHVMPEWTKREYPVTVEWSDGKLVSYTLDGRFLHHDGDVYVIPKPRKSRVVECWVYKGIFEKDVPCVIHPILPYEHKFPIEPRNLGYVKVRVEEVIDEAP